MRRRPRIASLLTAGCVAAACAGCYQRTVRAEGPGASRMNVEESYQQNWLVDELLFGQEAKKQSAGSGPRR